MAETALATQQQAPVFILPDENTFRHDLDAVKRFQQVAKACMVNGLDYGVIPGTGDRPTLLKPGAEKIAKLLGLADTYEIVEKTENWDKSSPFFHYQIRCTLSTIGGGFTVSQGIGECNSLESKYRWRTAKRKCPICGAEAIIQGKKEYGGGFICFKKSGGCGQKFMDSDARITGQQLGRVENDDIFSQVNTILKMAKKRALVDASLSAGRLSDIFTQDIEDMGPGQPETVIYQEPEEKPEPVQPGPSPEVKETMQAVVEKHDSTVSQASVTQQPATGDKPVEHYCLIHQTQFFKKGNMKSFAHPILENGKPTGRWCNEKTTEEVPLFAET